MGNFCLFVRMRALLDSVRETPPHLVAVVALFVRVLTQALPPRRQVDPREPRALKVGGAAASFEEPKERLDALRVPEACWAQRKESA